MKGLKTIIIIVCLWPTVIIAQAAGALPQGLWKVAQVTIEKNVDGNLQTTVYNTAEEVQSYIPCFREWEIKAQSIVIRYNDEWVETSPTYTIEGNRLSIVCELGGSYGYELNGNTLTLTTVYHYVNNLPTGHTEQIEEKWTISLKK
jgi:hypothetical protein